MLFYLLFHCVKMIIKNRLNYFSVFKDSMLQLCIQTMYTVCMQIFQQMIIKNEDFDL